MQETQNKITPRAWVGCLGCYNSGALNGLWLEGVDAADTDGAGLSDGGKCLKCGADEFWVMDHESYGDLLGGECSPLEAATIAAAIDEIESSGLNIEAIAAYSDNMGLDIAKFSEWLPTFEEEYIGQYENSQELADEYFAYSGIFDGIPEHLAPYFDGGAYVDNMGHGGDIWENSGHYFWNR